MVIPAFVGVPGPMEILVILFVLGIAVAPVVVAVILVIMLYRPRHLEGPPRHPPRKEDFERFE